MRGVRVSLEQRPRRALGQYYTPVEIAAFAVRTLARHGALDAASVRVIDPAAGPGLFLEAVTDVLASAEVIGLDVDPTVEGGHVRVGNGLVDVPEVGVTEGAFEVAVGNPPYGGLGLIELSRLARGEGQESDWRVAEAVARLRALAASLGPVPRALHARQLTPAVRRWLDRAFRHPIEMLFLERFVRLLRPGGWMAVVVPEGVLANARAADLRAFLSQHGRVAAIIGLPRVFAKAGAAARTALLVYQREPSMAGDVSVSDVDLEWTPRGQVSRRRVDLTSYLAAPPTVTVSWSVLRDQRWDPQFWDPRWASPLTGMADLPTRPLGDFIEHLTYGPIVTRIRPRDLPGDVPILSQGQIEESGIVLHTSPRVAAGSVFDPPRCRVRRGDLLFPRSGAGSLGRNRLAVFDGEDPVALGCFVDLIRLRGVCAWFVWLFLKTRFGWGQVKRLINGVGMPNISFDEIRSIRIPCVDEAFQREVEARWRRDVLPAHLRLLRALEAEAQVAVARTEAEARMRTLVEWVEHALSGGAGAPLEAAAAACTRTASREGPAQTQGSIHGEANKSER